MACSVFASSCCEPGADSSPVRSRPTLARHHLPLPGVARGALLQHAEPKILGTASHEWTARDLGLHHTYRPPVEANRRTVLSTC